MSYYCSNYYSCLNCQNIVNRFGERCDVCLILKSGASLSHGILPDESSHGSHNRSSHVAPAEAPRKHKHRGRDRSARSLRVDSQYQK